MTEATVVIKGRNDLSHAVRSAERDLKGLLRQGELVGKLFRGGAIAGALVAFERLAENAEQAAEKIGDKGTAKALKQLNAEIDNLKSKGMNLIGQVLGETYINFRGSALQKAEQDLRGLRVELERLLQSSGGRRDIPGVVELERRIAALQAQAEALALPGPSAALGSARRTRAMSRGGGSGQLVVTGPAAAAERAATRGGEAFVPGLTADDLGRQAWITLGTDVEDILAQMTEDFADFNTQALEDLVAPAQAATSEWTAFADEAARGMQRAFADFLFDPFEDGLKGMAAGFADMIRRMVAEVAAQQILLQFFTWGSTLGGGLGGFFEAGLKGITGKAVGGPVSGGRPYIVGEKGPELFIPGASGSITPNHALGGNVSFSYSIDARGADAERIMAVLPPLLKQSEDRMVGKVRELVGRGRLT